MHYANYSFYNNKAFANIILDQHILQKKWFKYDMCICVF